MNVVTLSLPAGDQVRIALQGAQVLSWQTADGHERLYLSPKALLDGHSPIRGGVPICFPQFNQRVLGDAPLPKHGFARTLPWTLDSQHGDASHAQARLGLTDTPATKALWPHGFTASLDVSLRASALQISFSVRNTGDLAWPFALALHTYLRVANLAETTLHGLKGQRYWDAVANLKNPGVLDTQTADPVRFTQETDRVYDAAAQALRLQQPGQPEVVIAQSANLTETVVWNPGEPLCATMADMPSDGFRHMLCVEAARINVPAVLQPGECWTGWQRLSVA